MPVPHHSIFLQAECSSDAQPTVSEHWTQKTQSLEIIPKSSFKDLAQHEITPERVEQLNKNCGMGISDSETVDLVGI